MNPKMFMVLDVKHAQWYEPAYAVGYVVVDTTTWRELDCGALTCGGCLPEGDTSYIMPCSQREMLMAVRAIWIRFANQGAELAAMDTHPAVSRFASEMDLAVDVNGLYGGKPVLRITDIRSLLMGAGIDPYAVQARKEDELPALSPLADARYAARKLRQALQAQGGL